MHYGKNLHACDSWQIFIYKYISRIKCSCAHKIVHNLFHALKIANHLDLFYFIS